MHWLSIAGKGNQLSIFNSSNENNFLLQSFTRLFIKKIRYEKQLLRNIIAIVFQLYFKFFIFHLKTFIIE